MANGIHWPLRGLLKKGAHWIRKKSPQIIQKKGALRVGVVFEILNPKTTSFSMISVVIAGGIMVSS